ncbi:hypothetical protein SPRG_08961 [Saprolegnia parasitica CBS 223.65]|uniref:subtilisin n=1 Tax=Saprolegnia parasitica (strain CBS 223.65) TaxID=695850 RepID=A0A067CFU2_SAPPC|nr:hypothetical protein SPRG_08961 [Saprolegnia parasitica CBS 223.65]KDO25662.1 hypothetical protein SPRG_08961 [Saprolegnia parasitica CBS 223.65]|eukprot:XP_012203692.1 hypothetical protein SPRG_08961 [Saprolegnia parasitica CBS 223.65]
MHRLALLAALAATADAASPLAHIFDLMGISTFHRHGVTGTGAVVGVTDSGLYMAHAQFAQASSVYNRFDLKARKVVHYETFADGKDQSNEPDHACGHGTHVSGILAGSAESTYALGVAPDARIAFLDIATDCTTPPCPSAVVLRVPTTPDALFLNQTKAGAKVISYSWGTASTGSDFITTTDDYDRTRAIDKYLYDHPEVLLVTAAGNAGGNGATSIVSPAGAKNSLTVGASLADTTTLATEASDMQPANCQDILNQDALAFYSSMGPTRDGRIKPDLVAPGRFLVSAKSFPMDNATSNASMCRLEGTSQATPVVSGMATLLYTWLRDGYWVDGRASTAFAMSSIPSSLLKALLLHSATPLLRRLPDMSSTSTCDAIKKSMYLFKQYPDPRQGYGRPNIATLWPSATSPTVYFYPNHTGMVPSLSQGYVHDYSVRVSPGDRLRVTIVWTDPPQTSAPRSTSLLTNDLDLSVLLPGTNKVVFPLSTNGQRRDSVNNIEMIDVSYETLSGLAARSASASGPLVVTVRVTGALQASAQDYSIVSTAILGAATLGSAPPLPTTSTDETGVGSWVLVVGVIGGVLLLLLAAFACIVLSRRQRNENGDYEALQTTVRNMFSRHVCPYCRFSTKDPVLLLAHVESAHAPTVAESREILETQRTACPHCHFKSFDAVALVHHVQAMHTFDDATSPTSSHSASKIFS